jgi:TPR repeat protein
MQNNTTRAPCYFAWLSALCLAASLSGNANAQAQPLTPDAVKGFAQSSFNSPVFGQLEANYHRQSKSVVQSISDFAVAQANAMLPKAKVLGERIRYGDHNVVSNDGEIMIAWMIELANAPFAQRNVLLSKLGALSERNIPEAMTFEGFVAEYGLFGTPMNLHRALQLYSTAAASNYQPAIYDLAIASAYGKDQPSDLNEALGFVGRAASIALDSSYRVCGFGAFLSYRTGDREQAMRYAKSCWSALAGIPRALYDPSENESQRITLLRASITTGIDDGYALLAQVTHNAGADPQYLACKYMLVNRYRISLLANTLRNDAVRCYQQSGNTPTDATQALLRYNTVVPGIIGFVPTEVRALAQERASNHFHYGWSVPYLPFRQQDVDLFEPFVSHTKQ